MAIDTLIAYVGVYGSVEDAEADYQLVKDLHREAGLIDGYDAAAMIQALKECLEHPATIFIPPS